MSEGARHGVSEAPIWLESLDRLFAKRTPRSKAAGPTSGRLEEDWSSSGETKCFPGYYLRPHDGVFHHSLARAAAD